MKLEGSIKGRERYIIGRRLRTTIHEFTRDPSDMLKPALSRDCAKIDMRMTCSGFPVQYEGRVNGKNAYYRDRHGIWRFEIYDGEIFNSNMIYFKEGISSEMIGLDGMLAGERRMLKYSLEFAKKHPNIVEPFFLEGWMFDKDTIQPCNY